MNSKGIIDGFEEDFNDIVDDFRSSNPDLRLTNFFSYWKEKCIDCIFANRFDPRELLESLGHINKLLVNVLSKTDIDETRWIISLYFLLCINCKQHHRLKSKIRIRLEDAFQIEQKISKKATDPYRDAFFAWNHLKVNDAIDFVEENEIYGPHLLRRGGFKIHCDPSKLEDLRTESLKFSETKISPLMRDIEAIIEPYEQMRRSLNLIELPDEGPLRDLLEQAKTSIDRYRGGS